MVLGLAASIYVHTSGEDIVDLGEAETSVLGGAFEGRAVSGEGDALGDASAAVVHAIEDEVAMGIGGCYGDGL